MQRYFLLLYQGLRPKVFYWEIINTVRKVSIVAISVFLSTVPLIYAGTSAVLLLLLFVRIQMKLNPYKLDLNNKLEIDAIITGGVTLFCGIMFSSDDEDLAFVVVLLLIVLIFMNIKFMMLWGFYMALTMATKYKTAHSIFMMLGVALMKRTYAEKLLEIQERETELMVNTQTVSINHKRRLPNSGSAFKKSKTKVRVLKDKNDMFSSSRRKPKGAIRNTNRKKKPHKGKMANLRFEDPTDREIKTTKRQQKSTIPHSSEKILGIDSVDFNRMVIIEKEPKVESNFKSAFGFRGQNVDEFINDFSVSALSRSNMINLDDEEESKDSIYNAPERVKKERKVDLNNALLKKKSMQFNPMLDVSTHRHSPDSKGFMRKGKNSRKLDFDS